MVEGRPVATQFTGKERDAETGLDYFGCRSALTGRFLPGNLLNPCAMGDFCQETGKVEDKTEWNGHIA